MSENEKCLEEKMLAAIFSRRDRLEDFKRTNLEIEEKKIRRNYIAIFLFIAERMNKAIEKLPEDQRKTLRMRFGIGEKCDHVLEEVGLPFEVTRERIQRIEALGLESIYEDNKEFTDFFIQIAEKHKSKFRVGDTVTTLHDIRLPIALAEKNPYICIGDSIPKGTIAQVERVLGPESLIIKFINGGESLSREIHPNFLLLKEEKD